MTEMYKKGGKLTLEYSLTSDSPCDYWLSVNTKVIKYERPKYEPKVGDKVTWGCGVSILEVIATHGNDMVWMLSEGGAYHSCSIKAIKDFRLAPDV